jgi:hypothetical protein
MNLDILGEICRHLRSRDVANLCIAIGDSMLIAERKHSKYAMIFRQKMQNFWYGRLCVLICAQQQSFWNQHRPGVLSITDHIRHRMASFFRGWTVSVCGKKLHASTRVLDDVISITVDLHSPHHSVRYGDPVAFKFDITHTSIPLDIDSYQPRGGYSHALVAVYETLREKSETQVGTYTPGGVLWARFVSSNDMNMAFEKHLGDGWVRATSATGVYFCKGGCDWDDPCQDGIQCRITPQFWTIELRTAQSWCCLRPDACSAIVYRGSMPSYKSFRGDLDDKLFRALQEFHEFGDVPPCLQVSNYSIRIKIRGKFRTFITWGELSRVTGISMPTLKKMSCPISRGVYIDFDRNTYRRKRISFDC